MQTTIYIRKDNEERWNSITDKSAWVNAYLSKSPPNSIVDKMNLEPRPMSVPGVVKGSEFVPRPPDPETGYPCCLGKRPCKHWQWDGNLSAYINSLTGKEREAGL